MTCTLSRKKKALLLLCLLCCIFVAYLQIFTIRSKANAVVGGTYADAKVMGFPCDLLFSQYRPDSSDFGGYSYGIIPNFNVFIDDESTYPTWAEGYNSNTPVEVFDIEYRNSSTNDDIVINFSNPSYLRSIRSALDVVIYNVTRFRSLYSFEFTLPYSVNYYLTADIVYSDGTNLITRSLTFPERAPVYSNNKYYYFLFDRSSISDSFLNQYGSFIYDGQRAVWLTSFELFLGTPPQSDYTNLATFNMEASPSEAITYTAFLDNFKDGLVSIFEASEVTVNFDDFSWTDWLVNSVGSFMNFEFIPGFSISGIFALLVGMSLFMVFLKVFAGG